MNVVQNQQHVPDILECLAQLSSDEVPTPPKLANAMLDLLPEDVWRDPELRWLDPCSKSGVFLREIATRLLFNGLVDWEPDFDKRREHIFRSMLFGCGITELTGISDVIFVQQTPSIGHSMKNRTLVFSRCVLWRTTVHTTNASVTRTLASRRRHADCNRLRWHSSAEKFRH